jgi:hypothetical protein
MIGSPVLSTRPHAKFTVIPNVVGLSIYEATRRLEYAGVWWQLTQLPSLNNSAATHLLDGYRAAGESPPAGTRVLWGGIDSGGVDVRDNQVTLNATDEAGNRLGRWRR